MIALKDLSGAPPQPLFPESPERGYRPSSPFPGNAAFGMSQGIPTSSSGGSESAWHQEYVRATQPCGKPPRREGAISDSLVRNRIISEDAQSRLQSALRELKSKYIFRNEERIDRFLSTHRSLVSTLLNAAPELDRSFGRNVIFSLEAVSDDDVSTTLYAIVIWRGSAQSAESALEDFDDRWWLNQTPQPGFTFTYELA